MHRRGVATRPVWCYVKSMYRSIDYNIEAVARPICSRSLSRFGAIKAGKALKDAVNQTAVPGWPAAGQMRLLLPGMLNPVDYDTMMDR